MSGLPRKLREKLEKRRREGNLRELPSHGGGVDFCSNDYLGFARHADLEEVSPEGPLPAGSGGSRLISGNHPLYEVLEQKLSAFHRSQAALVFNSGYDANVGLISAVPQPADHVFYDQRVHASIRDGLALCGAQCHPYGHGSLDALQEQVRKVCGYGLPEGTEVYVVTETVFSMEGDRIDLHPLVAYCTDNGFRLILDEAHATGVLGPDGRGAVVAAGLEDAVFARVVTFGKAVGRHGAAVLCSDALREYLLNYCRSLVYTTALPPRTLWEILRAYERMSGPEGEACRGRLRDNIALFRKEAGALGLGSSFLPSGGPIQIYLAGNSDTALKKASALQQEGYQVKPIRYPTVPRGEECIRFCLHSFNTPEEIRGVLSILAAQSKTEADG